MAQAITIHDEDVRRGLREFRDKGLDGRIPMGRFWSEFYIKASEAWQKVKVSSGGTFRGKHWDPMKPQYVRKDGTAVHAEGGVPRVSKGFGLKRMGGNVKGRKRTGRDVRVKSTDVLMVDTANMRRSMYGPKPSGGIKHGGVDTRLLAFPRDDLKYAERQNEMREFAFWQDGIDEDRLTFYVRSHLDDLARRFNRE